MARPPEEPSSSGEGTTQEIARKRRTRFRELEQKWMSGALKAVMDAPSETVQKEHAPREEWAQLAKQEAKRLGKDKKDWAQKEEDKWDRRKKLEYWVKKVLGKEEFEEYESLEHWTRSALNTTKTVSDLQNTREDEWRAQQSRTHAR